VLLQYSTCHTSVDSGDLNQVPPKQSAVCSTCIIPAASSATRELSVYLDGQRLRRECHPTYLGVTLDRTLSYREHLTKPAVKLKNQNNLLMKLAGSTWGASANTLRSSLWRFAVQQQSTAPQSSRFHLGCQRQHPAVIALALCYSAAEYCTPVWSRSAHTSQVDVKLNCTMHLISGTLLSTLLPWLPVLSNIELPALQRKAATDKLEENIVKHDSWPIQPDILSPP